jgi:hypothetical protein
MSKEKNGKFMIGMHCVGSNHAIGATPTPLDHYFFVIFLENILRIFLNMSFKKHLKSLNFY